MTEKEIKEFCEKWGISEEEASETIEEFCEKHKMDISEFNDGMGIDWELEYDERI